jgi:hypothetical protein
MDWFTNLLQSLFPASTNVTAPPVTFTTANKIETAMEGVGAIGTAIAGIVQGIQARKAAEAQADAIERQARFNSERVRAQGRRLLGRQRALVGMSGVRMDQDSPLAVALNTEYEIDLEARSIIKTGRATAEVARVAADVATSSAISAGVMGPMQLATVLTKSYGRAQKFGAANTPTGKPLSLPNVPPVNIRPTPGSRLSILN